MLRVILESPYAGNVTRNLAYARAAARDCFDRGEAPFGSHLIYPQDGILDDRVAAERQRGIDAGLAWAEVADYVVVYTDLGISSGMQGAIARHKVAGRPIVERKLPGWEP